MKKECKIKTNTNAIKKLLESGKKIALFGHVSPDGDCVGSMLGLGSLLEKQGKKVSYFVPSEVSNVFGFLPGIKKFKTEFDYGVYDVLVFVDFSSYGRISKFTQGNESYFDTSSLVVIDHHPESQKFSKFIIRDEESMSSAELVFENTIKWRPKLYDAKIATALYMGLTTDSGNFVYDEDHERIFTNALSLIKLGADKKKIVHQILRKRSLNVIKFSQIIIKRIEEKGGLLYSYYSDADIKKYNVDNEEARYALNIVQNIDGPKIVLILKKVDGVIKGSLRSKTIISKNMDCNIIAKTFGGGGHKLAAGFAFESKDRITLQVDKIVKKIIKMIK